MEYEIRFKPSAKKELERLAEGGRLRILVVFAVLRSNPYRGKKLKGERRDFYTLRSWPYRIVYFIDQSNHRVIIMRIKHRGGHVYQ